jgi:prepilin-type N-terminal cleavage/methylation domain-containing protein
MASMSNIPSRHPARGRQRGFTLLEVMIAMALLVVALAALMGHEAVAVQMSHYSNRVSQAALLAQGKLLDVQHTLKRDGMEAFDGCEEGDFRAEGYRDFQWKVCGYKLEFAEGASEELGEQLLSMLGGAGIPGLGGDGDATGGGDPLGGQMEKMAGQMGMALGAIPMFITQLEDKVRKVKLEVTWKDAVDERVLLLERFMTTLGTDPDNGPPPVDGAAEAVPQL